MAHSTTVAAPVVEEKVAEKNAPPAVNEDWLAVWVGAGIILLVLAGVAPAVPRAAWSGFQDLGVVFGGDNLARVIQIGILLLIPAVMGAYLLALQPIPFVAGFIALYALAWLSQILAGFSASAQAGLEYVIYALLLGLILGRRTSVRRWLGDAVQAEYYIKIGLVVLGASVLFSDLIEAGFLGIMQALIVVVSVWAFSFWLARRLKVDEELATMLASAVSICGVSAAIATCGAIHGDRKKLLYVTSIVLVCAVPMMIVMPWISKLTGMPDAVAGAWLGGTLDTSAAVVAAGELVSDQARNAAVVVKLSQNVLIGVAAFILTIWWTFKKGAPGSSQARASVIWERFPKFVIGFLAVSFVFSFFLSETTITQTRGVLTAIRTAWFALAFLSIGLDTSMTELVKTGDGRPAAAFLGGQAFNIVVTLLLAYLLFGGVIFSPPTFN